MQVKPNKTILTGRVSSIRPAADGFGADIELEVSENVSPVSEDDFLKPQSGETSELFFTEPEKLRVGDFIRAEATLLAGPFGSRAVIESVKKLKKAPGDKS